MCNDCHDKVKLPCRDLSLSDCFQLNEPKCDVGCEHIVSTDCVFQSMDAPSSKLPHIGVVKGASQQFINKRFDEMMGGALNTNFDGFNLNGLSPDKIDSLKLFVDAITKKVKALGEVDTQLKGKIDEVIEDLVLTDKRFLELNELEISSSKLGINNTDDTAAVIEKLVYYLDYNSFSSSGASQSFQDSNSVEWSTDGSHNVATVAISAASGNLIDELEDGLYVGPTSISETLKLIQSNTSLLAAFKTLVELSQPAYRFDIMAYENTQISYITNLGVAAVVQAKANELLQLKDVKRITTTPSTKLIITFKGI